MRHWLRGLPGARPAWLCRNGTGPELGLGRHLIRPRAAGLIGVQEGPPITTMAPWFSPSYPNLFTPSMFLLQCNKYTGN